MLKEQCAVRRSERGSVLFLFPAGVLIVFVLAAIAVDASIAFLGERELSAAVAAAANDAATEAISDEEFYGSGRVALDQADVERVAEERVRTSLDTGRHEGLVVHATVLRPSTGCAWALRVEASATVRYLFSRALPGGPDEVRVQSAVVSSPLQENMNC